MTPVFQDGSNPSHHAHKHPSPLQQVSHATIAKIFCAGGFLQPHESVTKSLQRAACHIIAIGNLKSQLFKYSICLLSSELEKGFNVKCFICEKHTLMYWYECLPLCKPTWAFSFWIWKHTYPSLPKVHHHWVLFHVTLSKNEKGSLVLHAQT